MPTPEQLLEMQNRYRGGKDHDVYTVVLKRGEQLDTTRFEEASRIVRDDGSTLVYCYQRGQSDSFVGHSSKKSD